MYSVPVILRVKVKPKKKKENNFAAIVRHSGGSLVVWGVFELKL